jgi:hypothetical protein
VGDRMGKSVQLFIAHLQSLVCIVKLLVKTGVDYTAGNLTDQQLGQRDLTVSEGASLLLREYPDQAD